MKNFSTIFTIGLLCFVITGCATLTKSQFEAIEKFAESTGNFSDYPSGVMKSLDEICYNRNMLEAATLGPEKVVVEVKSLYNYRKQNHALSSKADISFQILDQYANALAMLAADTHEEKLKIQAKALGNNIDTLIVKYNSISDVKRNLPVNLGKTAGQLLILGGNQWIRCKQAKWLREYIISGDTLVQEVCKNIETYLEDEAISDLIENEESSVDDAYLSFLKAKKPDPEQLRSLYNPLYTEMLEQLDKTRQLKEKSLKSIASLKKAHSKLADMVIKRKKLKDQIEEVKNLYFEIYTTKEIFEKIKIVDKP